MRHNRFLHIFVPCIALVGLLLLGGALQPRAQARSAATITIWHSDPTSGLPTIVSDYQALHPEVTFSLVHFPDPAELHRQYLLEVPTGGGPDLVLGPNEWIGVFAYEGLILPIDASFDLSLFVPQTQEAVVFAQKSWAVPATYGNQLMLYYNKNLVTQPVPANTDDWIALAQTLTVGDQYGLVYDLVEPFWLIPWLTGHGGWVFDENLAPPTPTLGTPEMTAALQFLHDLRYVAGILPPGDLDYGPADDMFMNGEAAMIINGDWALENYLSIFGSDLGIAMLPQVSDTALWPQPMTSGKFFYFSANLAGPALEANQQFVAFASTQAEQLRWAEAHLLPALQTAFNDPFVQNDPILQILADQAAVGRLMPVSREMGCAWEAMFEPFENVMADTQSPSDAALQMQASAETCIDLLYLNKYWTQSNRDGFADPENQQVASLEVFGDYLYAGVWNVGDPIEAQVWRSSRGLAWELVDQRVANGAASLQAFEGYLYAGSWDGLLWRTANGLVWEDVVIPGFDPTNGIARMEVFDGYLYVGTWRDVTGTLMWRTSDGIAWQPFAAGIGDDPNNVGAISSAVFNGRLYYGIENSVTGAELWSTDGVTWSLVQQDGFGSLANEAVSALAVFEGDLYASMLNANSLQVWLSPDGLDWTHIVDGNIGPVLPDAPNALEVYNGSLYLVTGYTGQGLQVWRTPDGSNWTQVGFVGFGDPYNDWTYWDSATTVFDGRLYVGTNNFNTGGEVWKYYSLNQFKLPIILRR